MDSTNYDSNLAELVAKKAKIRMALREEFIKQIYNPHRHATGQGGTVFDPAHQRYLSMNTNRYRYFKPTPKTTLLGFALVVFPIWGTCTFIVNHKRGVEHLRRTGQISYRDRDNKFF